MIKKYLPIFFFLNLIEVDKESLIEYTLNLED